MSKGKSKTGSRSGSDSNNGSRASASDTRHDSRQMSESKSIKAGTEQGGKLKESEGGSKRDVKKHGRERMAR